MSNTVSLSSGAVGTRQTCTREQAWQVRWSHHPPTIGLVRPSRTVPISVTGTACALDCAHCGGHYLAHMQPLAQADLRGATSCLISGGCDARGVVPIAEHAAQIAALAPSLRLNLHVGLMDAGALAALHLPIDVISFDVVGDVATAREVYGLDVTLAEYVSRMRELAKIAPVVPHITIGLHGGEIRGEYAALDALRALNPRRLVFLVLIPTAATRYAQCEPPPLSEVEDVLLYARGRLPDTALYLGCMRPHGRYRQQLDEIAIHSGLNAIVNPTRAGERAASAAGLTAVWSEECCALE